MSLRNVGVALARLDEYERVRETFQHGSELSQEVMGASHLITISCSEGLANCLESLERVDEAEKIHRQILNQKELDKENPPPDILLSLKHLADTQRLKGNWHEAETLYRQTLTLREKVFGAEHQATLESVQGLAMLFRGQQR